jgi:hypothetical protein
MNFAQQALVKNASIGVKKMATSLPVKMAIDFFLRNNKGLIMPDSTYFARPEIRLAIFLENLRARNRPVKTASIDFTDTPALIKIVVTPLLGSAAGFDSVILAAEGLTGFSVVAVYPGEELSDENVIAEYENDTDIDKV